MKRYVWQGAVVVVAFIAGAMLGTPVGISWAKSMLEKKTHQAAVA